MASTQRLLAASGAILAALADAWFITGTVVNVIWPPLGAPGVPAGTSATRGVLEELGLFTGLGAAIIFCAALAIGRFSVAAADRVEGAVPRRQLRAVEPSLPRRGVPASTAGCSSACSPTPWMPTRPPADHSEAFPPVHPPTITGMDCNARTGPPSAGASVGVQVRRVAEFWNPHRFTPPFAQRSGSPQRGGCPRR